MSFLEAVTDQLNLRWAWEKVRRASNPGDVWIDEIELAGFEVELEHNLQKIAAEMRKGRYRLRSLRPMAFPKNPKKDGTQQARQYFNVAVRDQVAWTAVVNVIGPYLDPLMPAWSYGNRLFRSIWVDTDENGVHHRKIGRYRHSSGKIYLPFGQSWPIFRRHVFLATSAMTAKTGKAFACHLTEEDAKELSIQELLKAEHRCPFVRKEYWGERQPAAGKDSLFWCSVDLEKFYPSFNLAIIQRNIYENLPAKFKLEAEKLIDSMMRFRIDTSGWLKEELAEISLRFRQRAFKGIPTGLYVAGFLANVGLLKVDMAVTERLKNIDIAHFRFVDDHIVLAYSFDDLVKWVDGYLALLEASGTGARVNPEKIEPEALATYYLSRKKSRKRLSSDFDAAAKACKLNPQFPSPLMTKTLALVSAIAKMDFNLLEESELVSLTDQLEHMLLVELPEAEIPEKTRWSFAATRLMRLAECRLSNNAKLAELACRCQELDAELADEDISPAVRETKEVERKTYKAELKKRHNELSHELDRAFDLLRKVLQDRPDRVRLWTRAIQMCRQTGVSGIVDILDDIRQVNDGLQNKMAAEYLLANTLSLLGSEAIIAARLVTDPEVAEWRRRASHAFLSDLSNAGLDKLPTMDRRWFLQTSWEQLCFGVFCADLILRSSPSEDPGYECELPAELIAVGRRCFASKSGTRHPQDMAWWAARSTLGELSSRAHSWVAEIGRQLSAKNESSAFWRFFPFDVPAENLRSMRKDRRHSQNIAQMAGWWYDALSAKREIVPGFLGNGRYPEIACVNRNLQFSSNSRFVSLHKWCLEIRQTCGTDAADPRTSEWTALEIVRQIGRLITESGTFGIDYVAKMNSEQNRPLCLHPANFRVPRKWLEMKTPTWGEWTAEINRMEIMAQVDKVAEPLQIADFRYTPVSSPENVLFYSVNPVRGLGLLLYGLLRHDFDLPTAWNGPGHADILGLLPRRLLKEMTCSSWTLGVLQACLQPRAMENLFIRNQHQLGANIDDDSLHDPIPLLTAERVCWAIEKCKAVLEQYRLSTINHRARQLTPISIQQLSWPDWAKAFGSMQEGGGDDEP